MNNNAEIISLHFYSSGKGTVVIFSAEWADQCAQIIDVLSELSSNQEYAAIQFLNVPAEDLSELSLKNKIEAVPTCLFYENGKQIDRIDGVDVFAITTKCKYFVEKGKSTVPVVPIEERLKSLIHSKPVMVFMKGDRNAPRCGFSKQLIAILNETNVSYGTFDILQDEDVRQGLKTYSDWPTYPQVYVKGELIGGLDIIKELAASKELFETLTK